MDPLIDAITRLIENPDAFKGQRPAAPRETTVDLGDAPASVQRLAAALATRYYDGFDIELQTFPTPASFLAFLDDRRGDEEPTADLEALRAAR